MEKYIVKKHDSLWKIARHFKVTVDALAAANNLKGRQLHTIQIDQVLLIPDRAGEVTDTQLALKFRGLDFSKVTPKKIKVQHDGKEEVHELGNASSLMLAVRDHAQGLKVWVEDLEKKLQPVLDIGILPLGKWSLALDSRMVKAEGALQPKKGPPAATTPAVKEAVTHNAQLAEGKTAQQQTRAEAGAPTHGLATIYTEKNLRLTPGNEQFRKLIIAAAEKYGHTPQSLAALIDAEAAKIKGSGGTWNEKSNEHDSSLAQGLAQFFPAAWTDVFNYSKSMLHADCQKMTVAQRLAKRREAKYAIDGAAAYATLNLAHFEKVTGLQVSTLSPDEKAKFAYFLHHEGVKGARRLLGFLPPLDDDEVTDLLAQQLGRKNTKALQSVLSQYDRDPHAAYQGWLFSYVDAKINVNNFLVADSQAFATPPRTMADIVKSLGSKTKIATPAPKPAAAPAPKAEAAPPKAKPAAPAPPASAPKVAAKAPPAAAPAAAPSSQGAAASDHVDAKWHDPLDVCTLRTAGLSGTGAKFGMTRNNGTKAHQGIDLAAEPGTPIYAVANGTVYSKKAPDSKYAYGDTLVLVVGIEDLPEPQASQFRKVNPGAKTIGFFYAHLSEIPPEGKAKQVFAGDVIGKTGCTGNASKMTTIAKGAHLHLEVRKEARLKSLGLSNRVDPLPFINNCTNR